MPYTLKFSDPTKSTNVTVPDMPPGINNFSTSIALVGPGYPNYGEKIAGNFLHLLENFASPYAPTNAIEGQLWYDTSDPSNKVLRVMDGTATSTRWPSATGIYQQNIDPHLSLSVKLKTGDIWVDTLLNQLKIFNNNSWTVVGPTVGTGSSKTGTEATTLSDVNGTNHPVILSYVSGSIIAITSDTSFIPNPVIDGFSRIKSGITLSTSAAIFNGTASSALALRINGTDYASETFLRKDDPSGTGQVVTGNVLFQTAITIASTTNKLEYVQLYKDGNNAVLFNNKAAGQFVFKTKSSSGSTPSSTVVVGNSSVAINTSTNITGDVNIIGQLVLHSTASITGNVGVTGNLATSGNITVAGKLATANTLTVGSATGSGAIIVPANTGTYDIGTAAAPFRSIYASAVHADTFNGSAISFPGMIMPFGGAAAPQGWLLCDGASYTTSTHAALFNVIGYKYGSTTATTAKVPNMSTSTFVSTGTNTGTYLTYIIKL